jgi:dethiobiotin synthetase
MSAKFITGTGTDIGKTWLSCALLRHWRACGLAPQAFKPVVSGFSPETADSSDVGQLLAALGRSTGRDEWEHMAPWRFAAPLSPDMAAALEGRSIDFAALVAYTRRLTSADSCAGNPVLVEGVGGVMVPLDGRHTVRDWIAGSGLPAVVVAGSYLGSLSHTLTALEALRTQGIAVDAVVINETADSTVGLAETAETLRRHAGGVAVLTLARRGADAAVAAVASLWDKAATQAG